MRNCYVQVALTYTKPWPLRIWAMVAAAGIVCLSLTLALLPVDNSVQTAVFLMCGVMAVWVGAMIVAHVKEQLADPRAALMPRFRTPHLVVAAVMFAIFVVGPPLAVASLPYPPHVNDVSPSGYLALVLIMAAAMAWLGQLQAPMAVVIVFLLITPVWFASGRAMLNDIVHGRASELSYLVLAVSTTALLSLWWRLALMHAEMPEYARTMGPGFRLRVQMTGDPGFRRENAAGSGAVEAWVRRAGRLDHVASVAAAGFWQRVRHWWIVIGMGRTSIFVALLLGLWAFIMPHITGGMRDKHSHIVVPVMLSVLVPGVVVAAVWPRRWYTLADESLRPASRRQFVREQGAAMAMELAMSWLMLTAALFAGALLLEPSMATLSPLGRALPLIVSAQILIFGIIVWVMRYRSGWLVIVPIFLATFTGTGVIVIGGALSQLRSIEPILIAAAIFAAAGVAITFDAYRRWLTTEFD